MCICVVVDEDFELVWVGVCYWYECWVVVDIEFELDVGVVWCLYVEMCVWCWVECVVGLCVKW